MYIDGSHQYFIDRDNALFEIEGLTFYSDTSLTRALVDTLVDGEMVIDKDAEGKQHPRYLIYDLISLEGNQISRESFTARMHAIQVTF
jgi:mRNA-capping enzyme